MFNKSQAALEFLTTYGWAFVVILIMISALTYFGILNPRSILPGRCNFGAEIGCIDYAIVYSDGTGPVPGEDGTFKLRLKNSVGEPIKILDPLGSSGPEGIVLSSETATNYDCTLSQINGNAVAGELDGNGDYVWSTGDPVDFSFTGCNSAAAGFKKGSKAKVHITLIYYLAKSDDTYTHQVKGEIIATAG